MNVLQCDRCKAFNEECAQALGLDLCISCQRDFRLWVDKPTKRKYTPSTRYVEIMRELEQEHGGEVPLEHFARALFLTTNSARYTARNLVASGVIKRVRRGVFRLPTKEGA